MEYSESLLSGVGVHMDEALATGGQVTVIGLFIVFAVLVILMIVLMLFKVFFYKAPSKASAPAAVQEPAAAVPAPAAAEPKPSVPEEDEEELIAVLTAAAAASMNTSTYNLRIKSYRRVPNTRPAWNRAGISDTIGNRF